MLAMPRPRPRLRLFVAPPLARGGAVDLGRAQAHYLRTVMRAEIGDEVALFNGRDGEWTARIDDLGKTHVGLVVEERLRPQEPEPGPWLVFAPVKKEAMDFIVQKATELGAARLIPVLTRRTIAARVNQERMRAQTVEAAEQCERLSVPEVEPAQPLPRLLAAWPPERRLLVADESGTGIPVADLLTAPAARACPWGILVGPEGGFAADELDALRDLPFVSAAGFGPRVMRAETAAVAALACWQALVGDWHRCRFQVQAGDSHGR